MVPWKFKLAIGSSIFLVGSSIAAYWTYQYKSYKSELEAAKAKKAKLEANISRQRWLAVQTVGLIFSFAVVASVYFKTRQLLRNSWLALFSESKN